MQGGYHWHKHDDEDEFFLVIQGRFLIDPEGRTVELAAGQGLVVPKGVVHRTRAPERAVVLMVEARGSSRPATPEGSSSHPAPGRASGRTPMSPRRRSSGRSNSRSGW